jgi:hypothetical protein
LKSSTTTITATSAIATNINDGKSNGVKKKIEINNLLSLKNGNNYQCVKKHKTVNDLLNVCDKQLVANNINGVLSASNNSEIVNKFSNRNNNCNNNSINNNNNNNNNSKQSDNCNRNDESLMVSSSSSSRRKRKSKVSVIILKIIF